MEEFNFVLLVAMALVGMTAKLYFRRNPLEILGTLSLVTLFAWVAIQVLPPAIANDSALISTAADRAIDRLVPELGSMLVGEVAGFYATAIFQTVRNWLRGGRRLPRNYRNLRRSKGLSPRMNSGTLTHQLRRPRQRTKKRHS